jgi:hypothetical protein
MRMPKTIKEWIGLAFAVIVIGYILGVIVPNELIP